MRVVLKELKKYANAKRKTSNEWFFKTGPGQYGAGDRFIGVNPDEFVSEADPSVLARLGIDGAKPYALHVTPKPPIPYWLMAALCLTGLWAGIWWVLGRDARGRGTVIPEYDPPRELKPYEAEALLKADPTTVGITATILDFARQGWLTIEQKKQYLVLRISISIC
jgi:hypothetical protein